MRVEQNIGRMSDLTDRLVQKLKERGLDVKDVDKRRLQQAVENGVARLVEAWPDIDVDMLAFIDHLAIRVPDEEPDIAAAVATLAIEDLYLAFACAERVPAALAAFERTFADELAKAVVRIRGKTSQDDARQRVWQKLFVATEGRTPKILDYSGRGRLRYWYRVAVVRTLLDDLRRPEDRSVALDEERIADLVSPEVDPETEYLKRLYRHEFQAAFELAVRSLTAEDRNVLRSYYVSNLTIDQIASVFGIHRATAARRVERAREKLLSETRRTLGEQLRLSKRELESVIRLIESQLHVSIARLLDD